MTRFEKEISGALGEYWKKSAMNDVNKAVEKASKDAMVEEDGAIRWLSNGSYIPDDFCEMLEYAGFNFSRKATEIKRDIQVSEELAEYRERMKNYKPSREELSEMRAAFGKGATVIDVITGEPIYL